MRVLFIHQNCPGQYKHLSRVLASRPDNQVVFITQKGKQDVPGVTKLEYEPKRQPSPTTHYYIRNFEGGILNGQAVARVALALKKRGFTPDIVCAHPGWGESLYIKDVYPDVPLLNYCEFFYRQVGADVGFDPEYPLDLNTLARVRTRNALHLLSIEGCDQGISPTRWQRTQFPKEFHYKIATCHDGIDTDVACPDLDATLSLPDGTTLSRRHEVVTYVARNLEPYRGFPSFIRAVAEICTRRPHCHILIVGGDEVSYGRRVPGGTTYREKMLSEVKIDPKRVHFLGKVSYATFIKVLQVSSVHVYLTYPFVLSWSMLEAMAAGCLVVGSDTAPVTEVLSDGKNGLLVDFFSPSAIADRIDEVLDHKDRMGALRERARQTILESYQLGDCLQGQVQLMEALCDGQRPSMAETKAGQRKTTAKKGSGKGSGTKGSAKRAPGKRRRK
jgi:glycosyltransferase involved in cell wall biosynthesis